MLVDSHCHLDFPDLAENLPEIFAEMHRNGVGGAVCIGTCCTGQARPGPPAGREAGRSR